MAGRTVVTPSGDTWRVRRVWVPRLGDETLWSRLRRRSRLGGRFVRGAGKASDAGCGADLLSDVPILFVGLMVLVMLSLVGFPLVLAVVDVVVLALLTVLAVAVRVVFRRPWVVDARLTGPVPVDGEVPMPSDPPRATIRRHTWRVVGFRASGDAMNAVANALAHGNPLPPDSPSSSPPAPPTPPEDRVA